MSKTIKTPHMIISKGKQILYFRSNYEAESYLLRRGFEETVTNYFHRELDSTDANIQEIYFNTGY